MHLAIRSARLVGPPERDSTAMRWIHRGDSDAITWVNANSARTAYIPIRVPVCRPELANLKERHVYAKPRGILLETCATMSQFRSEEHTSELQSLMRISYAVFCLKKKKHINNNNTNTLSYK